MVYEATWYTASASGTLMKSSSLRHVFLRGLTLVMLLRAWGTVTAQTPVKEGWIQAILDPERVPIEFSERGAFSHIYIGGRNIGSLEVRVSKDGEHVNSEDKTSAVVRHLQISSHYSAALNFNDCLVRIRWQYLRIFENGTEVYVQLEEQPPENQLLLRSASGSQALISIDQVRVWANDKPVAVSFAVPVEASCGASKTDWTWSQSSRGTAPIDDRASSTSKARSDIGKAVNPRGPSYSQADRPDPSNWNGWVDGPMKKIHKQAIGCSSLSSDSAYNKCLMSVVEDCDKVLHRTVAGSQTFDYYKVAADWRLKALRLLGKDTPADEHFYQVQVRAQTSCEDEVRRSDINELKRGFAACDKAAYEVYKEAGSDFAFYKDVANRQYKKDSGRSFLETLGDVATVYNQTTASSPVQSSPPPISQRTATRAGRGLGSILPKSAVWSDPMTTSAQFRVYDNEGRVAGTVIVSVESGGTQAVVGNTTYVRGSQLVIAARNFTQECTLALMPNTWLFESGGEPSTLGLEDMDLSVPALGQTVKRFTIPQLIIGRSGKIMSQSVTPYVALNCAR